MAPGVAARYPAVLRVNRCSNQAVLITGRFSIQRVVMSARRGATYERFIQDQMHAVFYDYARVMSPMPRMRSYFSCCTDY